MDEPGFWSRVKKARLFQVLLIYMGASWLILQVVHVFVDRLGLPEWAWPGTVVLLLVGLVVILATGWVQSHPLVEERERSKEVPGTWQVQPGTMARDLARGRLPHLTWGRALVGGVVAFSLLFGFAGLYVLVKDRGQSFAPREAYAESPADPGIAVLPFTVRGPEQEVWREGMMDLLSTGLDGAPGVRAIDSRTVLARWRERVPDGTQADLATALEAAAETGARHALLGSAVAIGSTVRLVADVYEVASASRLGRAQVEGAADSVVALLDRLAMQVLGLVVHEVDADLRRVDLARVTTPSLPALKAYLEGEVHHRRSDFDAAREAYQRALQEDSTFALAHSRIADAYGWNDGGSPGASRHRELAALHADRLPPRERSLVLAVGARTEGRVGAVDSLRALTERYPDAAEIWYELGDSYYHGSGYATTEEIERVFQRAVELDPGFAPFYIHLAELAFRLHATDTARVAAVVEPFRGPAAETDYGRGFALAFDLAFGSAEARQRALARLGTEDPEVLLRAQMAIGQHPQHMSDRRAILEQARERGTEDQRRLAAWQLFGLELDAGRPRAALVRAGDPYLAAGNRMCGLAIYISRGLAYPEAEVDSIFRAAGPLTFGPQAAFPCRLTHELWRDRLAEFDDGIALARQEVRAARERADSTAAIQLEEIIDVLSALRTWREGRPAAALSAMQRLEHIAGFPPFWMGDLHREVGNTREAIRYYESPRSMPVDELWRGRLYEEVGEPERAAEAYRAFLARWADAEPELQPLVDDATAALTRLLEREIG